MGVLISKLVEEKKIKINYLPLVGVIIYFIFFFIVFNILIFPYLSINFDKYLISVNYIAYSLFGVVLFYKCMIIFLIKERSIIGNIIITQNQVEIEILQEKRKIELKGKRIRFYFDPHRSREHDGYSLLIIDDEKFCFKVNIDDEIFLKTIFTKWYENKFNFLEELRTSIGHRMICLDIDFDWKRLEEIKKYVS